MRSRIASVCSSLFGGAAVIEYFGLQRLLDGSYTGSSTLGGIVLTYALPGYVIVRGFFAYSERDKSKSLIDCIKEMRAAWKGEL